MPVPMPMAVEGGATGSFDLRIGRSRSWADLAYATTRVTGGVRGCLSATAQSISVPGNSFFESCCERSVTETAMAVSLWCTRLVTTELSTHRLLEQVLQDQPPVAAKRHRHVGFRLGHDRFTVQSHRPLYQIVETIIMSFVDPNPSLPKMTISLGVKADTDLMLVEFHSVSCRGR